MMNNYTNLYLFIVVLLANLLGLFIKFRPIRWKYFHISHHILYFCVMATALYSVGTAYFIHDIMNYYSGGVFLILVPLSLFKKGKAVHIFLGVTALLISGLGCHYS